MVGAARVPVLWAVLSSAFSSVGCSDEDAEQKEVTISVTGMVREYEPGPDTPIPLEGVMVCLTDAPRLPCARTTATGGYFLFGVPTNAERALLFTKPGYSSVAVVGTTGTSDFAVNAVMPTEAVAESAVKAMGFSWPLAGKGMIGFVVLEQLDANQGVAGAFVKVTPPSSKGPIYYGADNLPDATATTSSIAGVGYFGDLEPDVYTLSITSPPGRVCTRVPLEGWTAADETSIRVPAIADFVISSVRFWCA